MQWILQAFEDTLKLEPILERMGLPHSTHKVVPFEGTLIPEPTIADRNNVVLFGSYTLWRYAQQYNLRPGVFKLRPFLYEDAWHAYLLNGANAKVVRLRDIPALTLADDQLVFMRPVDDSKEEPGRVWKVADLKALAHKVCALPIEDIPMGALRHETEVMLTKPVEIQKEWRIWVVKDRIVTFSLYKEGPRVIYRPEIDDDAMTFAQMLVTENPGYADAYVMDICRTADGLKMLETNCINAAGLYAADLSKLVAAISDWGSER